jgi:hypothetical protein
MWSVIPTGHTGKGCPAPASRSCLRKCGWLTGFLHSQGRGAWRWAWAACTFFSKRKRFSPRPLRTFHKYPSISCNPRGMNPNSASPQISTETWVALPQPTDKVALRYLVLFLLLSDTFLLLMPHKGGHSLTETLRCPPRLRGSSGHGALGLSSFRPLLGTCVLRAGTCSQKVVWVPTGRYFQRCPGALKLAGSGMTLRQDTFIPFLLEPLWVLRGQEDMTVGMLSHFLQ